MLSQSWKPLQWSMGQQTQMIPLSDCALMSMQLSALNLILCGRGPCLYVGQFSALGCKLPCFLFSTWYSQGPGSKYKEPEVWKIWRGPVLTVWLPTVGLGQGWGKKMSGC